MALLTPTIITRDLTSAPAFDIAASGDEFVNTGFEFFCIFNGNVGDCIVTIAITKTVDGLVVTNKTVVVGNDDQTCLGPFPKDIYNDGEEKVQLTYSLSSGVTIMLLKLTNN